MESQAPKEFTARAEAAGFQDSFPVFQMDEGAGSLQGRCRLQQLRMKGCCRLQLRMQSRRRVAAGLLQGHCRVAAGSQQAAAEVAESLQGHSRLQLRSMEAQVVH